MNGCQTTKKTATIPQTDSSTVKPSTPVAAISAPDSVPVWAPRKGNYNPERTKKNDLLHTKLEVSFDWQKQYLNGIATLTFKPYFYPQNTLELDAKGFDIKSINLFDPASKSLNPLQFTYDKRIITIQLNKTYKRTENYQIQITYTAKPNELPAGGSEAITSDKGLYFINPLGTEPNKPQQIWTQGETEANSAWFPTIDSPNERTTQEMYITVDTAFTTLSNGTFVYSRTNRDGTKTDYWKQDKPHAPYLFMMAIGKFAVVNDEWKGMPVDYYVEPAYAPYAKDIFGRTPEMIEFFSTKLNYKFPWEKYAQVVVRDFVSGAMENTTAVTFMEAVQSDKRQLLDDHWDGIIAHELFHHWFGDLVTTESWANLPLNESFANYAEYLWAEYKYGKEQADYLGQIEVEQYFAESENKQEPLIRYRYLDKEDMFDSHSYAKGGRILHMLRKYVGDEAFFEALHQYLKKNEFTDVEIHNLRLAFEEVTGEDLNWFFNQWFMSAGHPDLAINHTYTNGKIQLDVKQLQDSTYTPIYKLPIKVVVWANGQKTLHDITITQASQAIELPAATKPDLVLFDAESQLLGKIYHPKSSQELAFQYYNGPTYLSRYQAIAGLTHVLEEAEEDSLVNKAQSMDNLAEKVAADALKDSFWGIRQLAIKSFEKSSGAQGEAIDNKIQEMALKDPRSYVRAEAMNALLNREKNYIDVFKQGLQDSSYTVLATSLFAYFNSGAPDAAQQVEKFKDYKNTDVMFTVAYFYAEAGDSAAYSWFVNKLTTTSSQVQAQLLQFFAPYLLRLDESKQTEGLKEIEKMATESQDFQVKLGAYQALGLFADREDVKEMRKRIRENEKDEKLKNIYNMIP
ncbi:M1 family metallopeptidase [Rhodocytophaga rosea]|uniref:Aminopeptidase N n=2 Tax=Rhodocytophaga rosea TaxID=2704465 RepID=A0A6C0GV52_9BACT|nr:M1 family metallopeptidase [Rhodocytophaga rosea]